ncbi:DedA family protein [Arsenicicoccus bolidensis]|uniref:DedA family protein n=1 Tax=Arsenicicoccus bolidensis TaxID=229480 RepID=A0ABS9Q6R7_9MICO|nr:DedA family protein [Arsenicicoccus bolidensis]MCG7323558.1 DedA family protein [Arsenicicoccus bolidensis]
MNLLHALTDPGPLLGTVGLLGLLALVFAETGLLVGFFLPGDSLLFVAGLLATQPHGFAPLWVVLGLVPVAAFLGDQVGFTIGRRLGPSVLASRAARLMGPDAIAKAQQFFDTHGARTVFLARFVPVVRTLVPTMAGVAGMSRRTFITYNIAGAIAWGVGMPLIGAVLGGFDVVRLHIDLIVLGIVALSLVPAAAHLITARRTQPRHHVSTANITASTPASTTGSQRA